MGAIPYGSTGPHIRVGQEFIVTVEPGHYARIESGLCGSEEFYIEFEMNGHHVKGKAIAIAGSGQVRFEAETVEAIN